MDQSNSNYTLSDQPFAQRFRSKLPVSYFLFRNVSGAVKREKRSTAESLFHGTDQYTVGNIYRPISTIV